MWALAVAVLELRREIVIPMRRWLNRGNTVGSHGRIHSAIFGLVHVGIVDPFPLEGSEDDGLMTCSFNPLMIGCVATEFEHLSSSLRGRSP